MRALRRGFTLLTCSLLLPLAACAPDAEVEDEFPPAEEMQTAQPEAPPELVSRSDAYLAAWNGNDPAALRAFFLEDATATVNDSTWTGLQAIEEHWLRPHVGAVSELATTETTFEQRGAEWYTEGMYTHRYAMPDQAEPASVSGHYMTTWARAADGQWKIRSAQIMQDEEMAPPAT